MLETVSQPYPKVYLALAVDFDGTLADRVPLPGTVTDSTVSALQRLKGEGKHIILVTGRRVTQLTGEEQPIPFAHNHLFDRVVAENGAILWTPETDTITYTSPHRLKQTWKDLFARNVTPLEIGRESLLTYKGNWKQVEQLITRYKLPLTIESSLTAILITHCSVNKANGLRYACDDLGITLDTVVGIGDQLNDLSFLNVCGYSAAVANAHEEVKRAVRYVSPWSIGDGVRDVIDTILLKSSGVILPERTILD